MLGGDPATTEVVALTATAACERAVEALHIAIDELRHPGKGGTSLEDIFLKVVAGK